MFLARIAEIILRNYTVLARLIAECLEIKLVPAVNQIEEEIRPKTYRGLPQASHGIKKTTLWFKRSQYTTRAQNMTTAKIWRFVAQIPLIKRTASCLFDDYFQHLSVGELTLDVTGTTSYIGELERWRNDLHGCG